MNLSAERAQLVRHPLPALVGLTYLEPSPDLTQEQEVLYLARQIPSLRNVEVREFDNGVSVVFDLQPWGGPFTRHVVVIPRACGPLEAYRILAEAAGIVPGSRPRPDYIQVLTQVAGRLTQATEPMKDPMQRAREACGFAEAPKLDPVEAAIARANERHYTDPPPVPRQPLPEPTADDLHGDQLVIDAMLRTGEAKPGDVVHVNGRQYTIEAKREPKHPASVETLDKLKALIASDKPAEEPKA
jgi:hypothetical protein